MGGEEGGGEGGQDLRHDAVLKYCIAKCRQRLRTTVAAPPTATPTPTPTPPAAAAISKREGRPASYDEEERRESEGVRDDTLKSSGEKDQPANVKKIKLPSREKESVSERV